MHGEANNSLRAFTAETICTSLPQVRRPLHHCDPWDHVGLEPARPRKDLSVVVACGGYGATNPAKSAMLALRLFESLINNS
jgi:hypothetical protein